MSLDNFEGIKIEDGYLIIRVKASDNPKWSGSGKTLINYTTGKARVMPDQSRVVLTWWKYPPR